MMEQSILPRSSRDHELSCDQLAACACHLLHSEMAVITQVTGKTQRMLGSHGLSGPLVQICQGPLAQSICGHAAEMGVPLVIGNGLTHPLVNRHPAVTDLGIVSYIGHPLRDGRGPVRGVISVCNTRPRDWSEDDSRRLAVLARLAVQVLRHARFAPAA
ncbi:GAF domain-containing protein [Thalassococcus sp. BH17M4-6]|uniref:GAF domain-containing protein n=1 Tax=Thalassococcus sp. BH17M4-6 TaxID=3413148 RepID=UPI003BDE4315